MHIFLSRVERLQSRRQGGQGAEESLGQEFPNLPPASSFLVSPQQYDEDALLAASHAELELVRTSEIVL